MIHPEFGPGRLSAEWLNTPCNEDPWILKTESPDDEGHCDAFIGNGYIGQRIGVEGEGPGHPFGREARMPSSCIVHGLWDETILMAVPTWSRLTYHDGEAMFEKGCGHWQDYVQQLDMRTGILTTELTWNSGQRKTRMVTEAYLSRTRPGVAVIRREITPEFSGRVTLTDDIDGSFIEDACNWRIKSEDMAGSRRARGKGLSSGYMSVELTMGPRERLVTLMSALVVEGAEAPDIAVETTDKSIQRTVSLDVECGQSYSVTKVVAIVTDKDAPGPWTHARCLVEGALLDLDRLKNDHIAAWAALWKHWIEVPHTRLQKTINASLYQFYANLRKDGRWSLGPTGLSANSWGGHAFWDSDLWMFPPVCLLSPDLARGFVEYRWDTLDGARRNALTEGRDGAMIAWQSGEFGDDTIPQKIFHHQHHVSSDVALAQWWFSVISGDKRYMSEKAAVIIIEIARFWASRAVYNEEQDRYEIIQVCGADEHAGIQDNNAYTNYSAVKALRLGQDMCRLRGEDPPDLWDTIADKMWIPFDDDHQCYREYEGYNGEIIKQADTAILVYPYEMPMLDEVKANIVDYYRSKYPKGNIMMAAAFDGIVDCELGRGQGGWESFEKLMPHFREPFLLTSESPMNNTISFVTGLGGLLQLVLMGFVGIRIRGDGLQVDPALPEAIEWIKVHGLHYDGVCFDLNVNGDAVDIGNASDAMAFDVYDADGKSWLNRC